MGSVFWSQGIARRPNACERSKALHIHFVKGECEARFNIRDPVWRDYSGFTRDDIRKMEERIRARLEECRAEWEKLYDKTN